MYVFSVNKDDENIMFGQFYESFRNRYVDTSAFKFKLVKQETFKEFAISELNNSENIDRLKIIDID